MRVLQCIRLATTAFEVTDLERLKVDALTYVARANHALGRFQEAYRYYQQVRSRLFACFSFLHDRVRNPDDLVGETGLVVLRSFV